MLGLTSFRGTDFILKNVYREVHQHVDRGINFPGWGKG
jgi:hypothetical protein